MFAKTSVVGANANSLYRSLAARTGRPPRWNFHKYLLDRQDNRCKCLKVPLSRAMMLGLLRRLRNCSWRVDTWVYQTYNLLHTLLPNDRPPIEGARQNFSPRASELIAASDVIE